MTVALTATSLKVYNDLHIRGVMSDSPTTVEVILSAVSNLDARKVHVVVGSLWGTSEIEEGFGRFLSEIYSGDVTAGHRFLASTAW